MSKFRFSIISILLGAASVAQAQTKVPTPEEMLAMIDQRTQTAGPYAELLADPDPARQLAAIEIMMETADGDLIALATEAGLKSTDPNVRQRTLEGYLATGPAISIVVDGSSTDSEVNFENYLRKAGAAISPEGTAGVTYSVGAFDSTKGCYVYKNNDKNICLLKVSGGGIQMFGWNDYFNFHGTLGSNGLISGYTSVSYVDGGHPTTLQLLP